MKNYILRYFEMGDKREFIQRTETFIDGLSARINYWLSCRNKRRFNVSLEIKKVK